MAQGISTSSVRAVVQGTGTALRMESARFCEALGTCLALQRALHRYTHALIAQITQTAACNCFHQVEARLARWLLMASDRLQSNPIRFTHEWLADLLGVRRVGVTVAASALQQQRLIQYSRGNITILDEKASRPPHASVTRKSRTFSTVCRVSRRIPFWPKNQTQLVRWRTYGNPV